MKKRILGLALACVLGMACLTGCGNNAPAQDATDPAGNVSAENEASGDTTGAQDQTDDAGTATEATITVEVVHADESTKEFTYTTTEEMLGAVLLAEELVVGEQTEYGLMISEVDGEQAIYEVDNAYWGLMINGEYAQTGVDSTPVEDGSTYSLVYTPAE